MQSSTLGYYSYYVRFEKPQPERRLFRAETINKGRSKTQSPMKEFTANIEEWMEGSMNVPQKYGCAP